MKTVLKLQFVTRTDSHPWILFDFAFRVGNALARMFVLCFEQQF